MRRRKLERTLLAAAAAFGLLSLATGFLAFTWHFWRQTKTP